MTKEQALKRLSDIFHRTRYTKDVYVPADVIAAILDYPQKPVYYTDRLKEFSEGE